MQEKTLFSTGISDTCKKCLEKLIDLTVKNATQDPTLQNKARTKALEILEELKDQPNTNPAHIANRFHPVIKTICRCEDPFEKIKRREMEIAARISKIHPPSPENLSNLIVYSLKGNCIDFFRQPEELEKQLSGSLSISLNEISLLLEKIKSNSRFIVFLPDNAGEVFFDLPLLKALAKIGHEVIYAVKEAPVQNDLCWKDIKELDIDWESITVISTGAATVGLELERTSGYFQSLYEKADIIIGKGMGHFETMWSSGDPRVFLLFQAKCFPVATSIGVDLNSGIACFVR